MAKRGKGAGVYVEMSGDAEPLLRQLRKAERKIDQLEAGLGKTARTGKRTRGAMESAFNPKHVMEYATSVLSVGAAVGTARVAWQNYLETMREISAEVRKASNEMIAFAALQEGGTKAARVREVAALGVQYGITDRGLVYNTFQAMQSAALSAQPEMTEEAAYRSGMAATQTILAAQQVGVPIEAGTEVEIMGRSKGLAAGEATRMAYRAGQLSSRTPEIIARGVQGIAFWDDPEVAFAMGSVLSGGVKPTQLGTYWGQAGEALSVTSSASPWFRRQEIRGELPKEATRLQRLEALHKAGIDTAEELERIGITERRQRQALIALVPNYPAVVRTLADIQETAKPGLLVAERQSIEAEVPMARQARRLAILEAQYAEEAVFGPRAEEATGLEERQRIRAVAMRRHGVETALGVKVAEEGQATGWAEARLLVEFIAHTLISTLPGSGRPAGKWGEWGGAKKIPPYLDVQEEMRELGKKLDKLVDYEGQKANGLGVNPNPDR